MIKMDIKYLVIEGNIGVGKTSLCKKIAHGFNAKLILEQFADNPFLPKFYDNPERYSFPLELSFLADRYNQLKKIFFEFELFKDFIVSDYFFMKSLIFASNTLEDDEYKLYRKLFDIIYEKLPKPDLYVYLHNSTENLLANIKKRGRGYEQNISREYLKKIEDGYFSFFKQQNNLRIVVVNVIDDTDFINSDIDYRKILELIFEKEYAKGLNFVSL